MTSSSEVPLHIKVQHLGRVSPDRDALVQAVLDALNVEDLRLAIEGVDEGLAGSNWLDLVYRLTAAADALTALREAQQ